MGLQSVSGVNNSSEFVLSNPILECTAYRGCTLSYLTNVTYVCVHRCEEVRDCGHGVIFLFSLIQCINELRENSDRATHHNQVFLRLDFVSISWCPNDFS